MLVGSVAPIFICGWCNVLRRCLIFINFCIQLSVKVFYIIFEVLIDGFFNEIFVIKFISDVFDCAI